LLQVEEGPARSSWLKEFTAIGNMKPQVYMHINRPDGKEVSVWDNYPKSSYIASPDECDVRCEQSRVHGAYPVYEVDASGRNGVEVHLKFENMLPGWAHGDGQYMFGSYADPHYFGWCVAQPRAKVTGTLKYDGKEYSVEGEGYHDHNWGDFNFYTNLSRWVWGRITTDELTADFADVVFNKTCGGVHLPLIMLARGFSVEPDCRGVPQAHAKRREGLRCALLPSMRRNSLLCRRSTGELYGAHLRGLAQSVQRWEATG